MDAPKPIRKVPAKVYSRVVGYYAPVESFNKGKQQEKAERVVFTPQLDDPPSVWAQLGYGPDLEATHVHRITAIDGNHTHTHGREHVHG